MMVVSSRMESYLFQLGWYSGPPAGTVSTKNTYPALFHETLMKVPNAMRSSDKHHLR